MAVNPTGPETFETPEDFEDGDAQGGRPVPEVGVEAPEADAAEQHTDVAPRGDDPLTGVDPGRADEADMAEQARTVALDEDDYR